jgi:chromosome segregation ATPase
LEYDYDISISAGSTMPVNRGAMLDLMIRLAQTPMPDGQMLVDREAVAEFLPPEIKAALLQRMQSHQTTMQQLQSSIEELGMALKQLAEESNANDEKTFSVIEDITETIEDLSNKILQLQQKHDKMEQEQAEKEKEDKIKREAYNKGFQDAEELYTEENENIKLPENPDALPDDILDSLSNMSDEELAELLQTNPEIEQLLEL